MNQKEVAEKSYIMGAVADVSWFVWGFFADGCRHKFVNWSRSCSRYFVIAGVASILCLSNLCVF